LTQNELESSLSSSPPPTTNIQYAHLILALGSNNTNPFNAFQTAANHQTETLETELKQLEKAHRVL